MTIRKANKTDEAQIQYLSHELNSYREKIFSAGNKEFHQRSTSSSKGENYHESIIFVATGEADEIIGFIEGSIHQRKNHALNKLGSIDKLYVKEEARGKGVAQNLFSKLESEFKKQGCDHMTTHTDFENEVSQKFYLQAGMNKTTVELWKNL